VWRRGPGWYPLARQSQNGTTGVPPRRPEFSLQIERLEGVQEAVLHREQRGRWPRGRADLGVDPLDVGSGSLRTDAQRLHYPRFVARRWPHSPPVRDGTGAVRSWRERRPPRQGCVRRSGSRCRRGRGRSRIRPVARWPTPRPRLSGPVREVGPGCALCSRNTCASARTRHTIRWASLTRNTGPLIPIPEINRRSGPCGLRRLMPIDVPRDCFPHGDAESRAHGREHGSASARRIARWLRLLDIGHGRCAVGSARRAVRSAASPTSTSTWSMRE
jgi:hypothetical protein